jgi:hypothetical protein
MFAFLDNQPQVTEAIKKVLKEDYNYDSTVSPLLVPTSYTYSESCELLFRILSALSSARSHSAASSRMTVTSCSTRIRKEMQCGCWLKVRWIMR